MAAIDDLKKQKDVAESNRDGLKTRLANATPSERAAIQKLYEAAKKEFNRVEKLFNAEKDRVDAATESSAGKELASERDADKAKNDISSRENNVKKLASLFKEDPNNNNRFVEYQNALEELSNRYSFYESKGFSFPRIVASADGGGFKLTEKTATADVEQTAITSAPRALTTAESRALATGRQLPVSESKPPRETVVTSQSVRVAKTEVDTALKNKGLADTPENRKKIRDEIKAGKAKPIDENAWIETFNKDYPAYSDWTTDQVVSYFGQDFVDIIKSTVESGIEYSDEELKALLKSTTYFNSVSDKQYKFDTLRDGEQQALIETSKRAIIDDYGDVGLSATDLAEIAKTAARSGLTGTGLKQTVYQYAFRKGGMATAPTSPAMATRALEGADADAIRKSARAYGYQVSDAEVEAALTGGMYNGLAVSKDSILEKAQKAAKGKYFHLADQIDAGLSLDDIFSTYKKYAATLLEVDENEIDYLSDPKWADAFGSKESGQLSLTDWTQKIKSDSKFGWQYTKQANDQATDIGLTLARAFGKVQ